MYGGFVIYNWLAEDIWLYGAGYGQVLEMYSSTDGGRVRANGDTVTGVTLANLTITSGRTDINSPTPAGYCYTKISNSYFDV